MNRRFILTEAREDRRILLRSSWRDKRALYNHYARNYVYESDLRGIPKSHVACCMMVSERYGIHPQELINEGIWGSIKNFFKRGEKAAEKKDETMDVSEEEIQAYMDSKAGVFKRWEQAKKDGASTWQGLKHAFGGIGSMFQQGQQVWDITGKEGAKLQIQAKKGFEQIKDQLESDFLKPIMQDLNKALKDEKLGQPQSGGFPNNPRAADFRHMLYGHTRFQDLESSGEMRGIFGYMLNAKAALQQAVDNAILDAKTANATVKKMVKVLQYYNGALDDSKRSAESRRAGMQRGNLLNSYSLELSMMGSDYWYRQMLKESDEGEEGGAEVINISDLIQGEAPEGAGELSPEDAKALGEFLSDPDNNEPPGGLSDKALNSMIAADGILGPLIVACVGAAFTALGCTMGGNPFGDFENSYAYTKFMNSLKGTEIHKLPDTIAEEMTEYTTNISVEAGEGPSQMISRAAGWEDVKGHTMGEVQQIIKEKGMTPEVMKQFMPNSPDGSAWQSLIDAPPDADAAWWMGDKHLAIAGVAKKKITVLEDVINNGDGGGLKGAIGDLMDQANKFQSEIIVSPDGKTVTKLTKGTLGNPEIKKWMEAVTKGEFKGSMSDWMSTIKLKTPVVPEPVPLKKYITKLVPTEITPGSGKHPLSLVTGSADIKKKVYQSVLKKGRSYVVRTFAAGKITGSAMAKVALPTILATTGTAMVAAGVSIAVLRKVVKSRQKTLNKCIEILSEPIKENPKAKEIADNMEDAQVVPATSSEEMEVQSPYEELDGVIQFPVKALKKAGASDDQAKAFIDTGFDAEKNADARKDLNAPPEEITGEALHTYSLKDLLMEDMAFDSFKSWAQDTAKAADFELDNKDINNLAVSFNLSDNIGDVTDLPDGSQKAELEKKLQQLEDEASKNKETIEDLDSQLQRMGERYLEERELSKELGKTLQNDKLSFTEKIKELEDKVVNGEVDVIEAQMTIDKFKSMLKAAKDASDKKEFELMEKVSGMKTEIDDLLKKGGIDQETIKQAGDLSQDIFGTSLEEILKDPKAFAEKYSQELSDKEQKAVDKVLKTANEKYQGLEQQYNKLKKASSKSMTAQRVYGIMKLLTKHIGGDVPKYSKLKKDKKNKYKEKIPKIQKLIKNEFGFDLEIKESSHQTRENLLLERWSQLAGLPAISEPHSRAMKRIIAEGNFAEEYIGPYDESNVLEHLEMLEAGEEVMMDEGELVALEEYCEFNQIDCDLDVEEYGNGFAVTMYQPQPYGSRR